MISGEIRTNRISVDELEDMAKNRDIALTAYFCIGNEHLYVWTDYEKGCTKFTSAEESNLGKLRPLFHALSGEMDAYQLKCPDKDVIRLHYGPLTTGLWEAGAFKILTYGERILNVTPDFGYKRRNVEKKVVGRRVEEAVFLIERLCGTYSVAYSNAFCNALENGCPERAECIRAIALELERLYNHLHVIQRLAAAASQKVATSHFSALVEEVLRLNAKLFHHRYAFGLNVPGGVRRNIDINIISKKLDTIEKDFEELVNLLLSSRIFIDRIHSTAMLSRDDILRLDSIGIAAKGSGVKRDVRSFDSFYSGTPYRIVCEKDGDSLARTAVRIGEIRNSIEIIRHLINELPQTTLKSEMEFNGFRYGRVEAAHGDVFVAVEVKDGVVRWMGIRPASLVNYVAFTHAVERNVFTDFPFAIESFGLSFADSDR